MARFIAELGSNHNREAERAFAAVDAVAAAGADALKIQVFRIEDLFAPEILAAREELRARRAWEFPMDLLEPLAQRTHDAGLQFSATAFGLWAIEPLAEHVDFWKVASYEILWHDLLRELAQTGKPIVISTGMAGLEEIDAAVEVLDGADLTILHCVSAYPTPEDQVNLKAIETLRERYDRPTGWSDHSRDPQVVERAVRRWAASDVEVHVDLPDEAGHEAGAHNWTPDRLAAVIAACDGPPLDDASPLDGDGVKRPMPAEQHDVPWRADPSDGLRPLLETRRPFQRA
jgi:N-acetylneuraminate synthase